LETERDGQSAIYVMDLDGHNQRAVIQSVGDDTNARWSPAGDFIAFESTRDGNSEIYVARADGSEPRRLTDDAGPDNSPAWSPDGGRIAFISTTRFTAPDESTEVMVINLATSNNTRDRDAERIEPFVDPGRTARLGVPGT
jgi:Tol biopolymer transport system component